MMLYDAHLHVGQFYERYTSPDDLLRMAERLGLDGFAVSSTTMCEENYSKVLEEFRLLEAYSKVAFAPVLWITPALLATDGETERFLDSGIGWRCLKIHPDLNPGLWNTDDAWFDALKELSAMLDVPVLIHTGGNDYSEAGIWERKIRENPETTFILAHCRPVAQAAELMEVFPNVYGDLAFVSVGGIAALLRRGLAHKLLWGTDFPIVNRFIEGQDMRQYQNVLLQTVRDNTTEADYKSVTSDNFKTIYNINGNDTKRDSPGEDTGIVYGGPAEILQDAPDP